MKPILLNDNIISTSAQRGITRYFNKIVDGAIAHFSTDVVVCSPIVRDYGSAKHIRTIRFPGSWRIRLQDRMASVTARLIKPSVAYNVYYGDANPQAAEVFTVYDMIHELTAPPSHPFIGQKRRCLQRASALLAISEHTSRDMLTLYPEFEAKTTVTQLGVDDFFFDANHRVPIHPGKPYLLYVGHRTPYKNFVRLLAAFGESGLGKQFDLCVISPGKSIYTPEEFDLIDKYRLHECIRLIATFSDAMLRDRYAGAFAFVYPSLYEGFGLPVLEAMACGTLVAASNTSSIPEVGGDVAFYFDPHRSDSIAECLRQVVDLPAEERTHRITQGVARAHTFTWKRCQQQSMNVFHQLASRD